MDRGSAGNQRPHGGIAGLEPDPGPAGTGGPGDETGDGSDEGGKARSAAGGDAGHRRGGPAGAGPRCAGRARGTQAPHSCVAGRDAPRGSPRDVERHRRGGHVRRRRAARRRAPADGSPDAAAGAPRGPRQSAARCHGGETHGGVAHLPRGRRARGSHDGAGRHAIRDRTRPGREGAPVRQPGQRPGAGDARAEHPRRRADSRARRRRCGSRASSSTCAARSPSC
jgi:hypothetical protein